MFARLWLYFLELRLQHYLGKHHAYRNRVHDEGATTVRDRLRIARAVLAMPPLERVARWAAYQQVVNRGERPW